MKLKQLGTILPTPESLARDDAHADREARKREQQGDRELAKCTKQVVGGEIRWYAAPDHYAIVSRRGAILWFRVTLDGDMRMSGSAK
jgi:hypothetical protein